MSDRSLRGQGFESPSKLGSPCVTPRDRLSKVQGMLEAGMGFRCDLLEQAKHGSEPPRIQKQVGWGWVGYVLIYSLSLPTYHPDSQLRETKSGKRPERTGEERTRMIWCF